MYSLILQLETLKIKVHCKNQKNKHRQHLHIQCLEVHATERMIIPPPVNAYFLRLGMLFVEKRLLCSGNTDNVFGSLDSMISSKQPHLHVSNLLSKPVTIAAGQVLGTARNPCNWLDQEGTMSESASTQRMTHAMLIQQLSESLPS